MQYYARSYIITIGVIIRAGFNLLHLTKAEARELGISLAKRKKPTNRIIVQTEANWQAKPIKGGMLLIIPENMPSLNVWKNWPYFKQHEYKTKLTFGISMITMNFRNKVANKARVEISHYHRVERCRDSDNYTPKFILDALKMAGLIEDDNHNVLDLPEPSFHIDRKNFRTEVKIIYG